MQINFNICQIFYYPLEIFTYPQTQHVRLYISPHLPHLPHLLYPLLPKGLSKLHQPVFNPVGGSAIIFVVAENRVQISAIAGN